MLESIIIPLPPSHRQPQLLIQHEHLSSIYRAIMSPVSRVDYENAGKTTILEKMTGSEAGVKPEIRDKWASSSCVYG